MKINYEKLTDIEKKLYNRLLKIWDEPDFLLGVLNSLESDEEREAVIEFIENNDGVTSEQIDLLSLEIEQIRDNDNIIMDDFFADLRAAAKQLEDAE